LIDNDSDRLNKPNEGMCSAGNDNTEEAFLIEDIVGHKMIKKKINYLVKWTGYPTDHNSWEPLENIRKPASRLIDTYLEKRKLAKDCWNPIMGSSRGTAIKH
jgi:Chromo (CHRromatin Organisation MOdifier) domain